MGKSTLVNALLGKAAPTGTWASKLPRTGPGAAPVSARPGCTRHLLYFEARPARGTESTSSVSKTGSPETPTTYVNRSAWGLVERAVAFGRHDDAAALEGQAAGCRSRLYSQEARSTETIGRRLIIR